MAKTQILAAALILSTAVAAVSLSELSGAKAELGSRAEKTKLLEAELVQLKTKQAETERALKDAEAEIQIARGKIEELGAKSEPVPEAENPAAAKEEKPAPKPESTFRVNARISAIEKFVPLNDDQRRRLDEKFRRDIAGGPNAEAGEGLDEILGKENAEYYRTEMRRAFDKAETEERERDVFYLSRKLTLSADQEARLMEAFDEAEAAVKEGRKSAQQSADSATMQDRIRLILEENKLRQRILNERLQKIFSAEQYQRYVEQHVDSSEGNFPVWHESE